MIRILLIALLSFSTISCSLFQTNTADNHEARCQLLKRKIIFTGATTNENTALRQRAELSTLNRNYRSQGCD